MTVGQDKSPLGIDDETRGLARLIPLGIEGPRAVYLDRNNSGGDTLQRISPFTGIGLSSAGQRPGAQKKTAAQRESIGQGYNRKLGQIPGQGFGA